MGVLHLAHMLRALLRGYRPLRRRDRGMVVLMVRLQLRRLLRLRMVLVLVLLGLRLQLRLCPNANLEVGVLQRLRRCRPLDGIPLAHRCHQVNSLRGSVGDELAQRSRLELREPEIHALGELDAITPCLQGSADQRSRFSLRGLLRGSKPGPPPRFHPLEGKGGGRVHEPLAFPSLSRSCRSRQPRCSRGTAVGACRARP
mmetsp:Transcript_36736/g.87292  ORF Transcript_36736/g.87292 Transcript_36736/m.87292 type:complete len:200 (+) Transcript_36736:843-1442(+)